MLRSRLPCSTSLGAARFFGLFGRSVNSWNWRLTGTEMNGSFHKKKLWRLHQNPVNFWANIHIMIILCVTLMQSILWRFKFRQLFNQQPGPLGWSARPTHLASVLRSKPHCDGSSYHHWIGFVGKICYKRWILPSNMVKHGFCNQIWVFPACFSLKP